MSRPSGSNNSSTALNHAPHVIFDISDSVFKFGYATEESPRSTLPHYRPNDIVESFKHLLENQLPYNASGFVPSSTLSKSPYVLIIEELYLPHAVRQKISSLLFSSYNVQYISWQIRASFIPFATGLQTCMVLYAEISETRAVSIVANRVITKTTEIVEKLSTDIPPIPYEGFDSQEGDDSYYWNIISSIIESIMECIKSSPIDSRDILRSNIVLTGGILVALRSSTFFKDLESMLEKRDKRCKFATVPFAPHALAWAGASVYVSTTPFDKVSKISSTGELTDWASVSGI